MFKYLLSFLPIFIFAQSSDVEELLTAQVWNISYNISPDGERIEEEDQEKIRSNFVKFNEDGTFEVPNALTGKTIGRWAYKPETNAIHFQEGRTSYRALIDELSELSLVLHYVDNGGFKIGLIHYIHVPTEKSNEEINEVLTSGKWNVVLRRFERIEDRVAAEDVENTWFEFYEGGTYQKSEIIDGNPVLTEGFWFLDEEHQLNLDASESTIYFVIGDKVRLILTTITGGYNTIEMRKSK